MLTTLPPGQWRRCLGAFALRDSRQAGPRAPFRAVENRALRRLPSDPVAACAVTRPVNDHLDGRVGCRSVAKQRRARTDRLRARFNSFALTALKGRSRPRLPAAPQVRGARSFSDSTRG